MKNILVLFTKYIKTKRGKIVSGIFLLTVVFISWRFILTKNNKVPIQTETVQKGTIVSSVSASGTINSSNIENVTTQASGTVKKVYVTDGQNVSKGQLIAEIELDTQGKQNHAQAYSSYINAKVGVNSAQNNYRSAQATAEKVLDDIKGHDSNETFSQKETRTKAEVSLDNAFDSLNTAKIKLTSAYLDYQTFSPLIYSPISGVIKSVTIAEGMNLGEQESASGATANQRVATIGTEGLPIASFNVSEIEVSKITTGQKATITLDSITDKTFTGKVVSVDRVGSTSNNVTTYPVIIKFDIGSNEILPNMAATANIITETKDNILVISYSSIKFQGEEAFVVVLKNGKQENLPVEIGISNDNQIEILSGLNEGDEIVINTSTTSESNNDQRSGSIFGGEVRVPGEGGMMR